MSFPLRGLRWREDSLLTPKMLCRDNSTGAQDNAAKADASAEPKQGPPSLQQQKSSEGREIATVARTQSEGRRSFDSLTGARSAAIGALPQPYWTSPTSHVVAKQQPEQPARSASYRCACVLYDA